MNWGWNQTARGSEIILNISNMALATIADMKLKLWQETFTTFETNQIQFYLDATEEVIKWMFWDFNLSNKIEVFRLCEVSTFIYVSSQKPISIIKVNWTPYTWILWTDYKIVWQKIYINDLKQFTSNFWELELEISAWYSPLPKDIIYFHICITEWELAKEWGKEVLEESLWPRRVKFIDTPINRNIIEQVKSRYLIAYF